MFMVPVDVKGDLKLGAFCTQLHLITLILHTNPPLHHPPTIINIRIKILRTIKETDWHLNVNNNE